MTTRRVIVGNNISTTTTSILVGRSSTGSTIGDYEQINLGSNLSMSSNTLNVTGVTKTYRIFTALDNNPPATLFATLDTRNSIPVLDFDSATGETAIFMSVIPEGVTLTGGLNIRLNWMATTATSGNCVWNASMENMSGDTDSDSFGTISSATTACNGTSGIMSLTQITLTDTDGATSGSPYRLKITRDGANASDTMTGDAELVTVEVRSI